MIESGAAAIHLRDELPVSEFVRNTKQANIAPLLAPR